MKKNYRTILVVGCCLYPLLILSGCEISLAKYTRAVQLSAPLSAGSTFAAQTHNGSITVYGADVADCNLTATITARAATEEAAKKLAEKTTITLEPLGNKLTAKIEKPTILRMGQSVAVSLDVQVPDHTSLELITHNGSVEITNITGQVNGATHNGKVTAEQVCGTAKLQTHNGSIRCKEISGDTQLKSHNGSVKVYYAEGAPPICNVSLITHNGGIDFTAPPDFSAEVEASTRNGSIKTDLPITVVGEVSKRKLKGTIGTGQGKLHLET
ncbi:MAG: DUF4097 family beta strand repeat-containing protein, partial [Planctomycetota bacterium]